MTYLLNEYMISTFHLFGAYLVTVVLLLFSDSLLLICSGLGHEKTRYEPRLHSVRQEQKAPAWAGVWWPLL